MLHLRVIANLGSARSIKNLPLWDLDDDFLVCSFQRWEKGEQALFQIYRVSVYHNGTLKNQEALKK